MYISNKKFREEIERRIADEHQKMHMEQQIERLGRDLYCEVGRLETMIRDIERRVMERLDGDEHAKNA